MITRGLNVRTTPAPALVNVGSGLSAANALTPVQGISPTFTYQSAFPRFHFHRFPFFSFGNPFFGFGYPYSGYPYYGYPYDMYGAGLLANPYAFATNTAFAPYGIASAQGFADVAANPYVDPGNYPSANPYAVAKGSSASVLPVSYSDSRRESAAAQVEVSVPLANAELWFNGEKIASEGVRRLFTSPPIERGTTQYVTVRAAWRDGTRNVTVERAINLAAGSHVRVEFAESPVRVTGSDQ